MAELENLKKFRKHTVDEKRKILANLYKEGEVIELQKQKLIDDLEKERQILEESGDLQSQSFFNTYATSVKVKVERLTLARQKMQTRIDFAQEEVRAAFAEFKKIEITQRERKKKERKELDKKEAAELDEISIDGFRRKEDE